MRLLAVLLMIASAAWGQKYTGPRPPKADLPYLKHAENLIPTEVSEAKEEKGKKDDITYADRRRGIVREDPARVAYLPVAQRKTVARQPAIIPPGEP